MAALVIGAIVLSLGAGGGMLWIAKSLGDATGEVAVATARNMNFLTIIFAFAIPAFTIFLCFMIFFGSVMEYIKEFVGNANTDLKAGYYLPALVSYGLVGLLAYSAIYTGRFAFSLLRECSNLSIQQIENHAEQLDADHEPDEQDDDDDEDDNTSVDTDVSDDRVQAVVPRRGAPARVPRVAQRHRAPAARAPDRALNRAPPAVQAAPAPNGNLLHAGLAAAANPVGFMFGVLRHQYLQR